MIKAERKVICENNRTDTAEVEVWHYNIFSLRTASVPFSASSLAKRISDSAPSYFICLFIVKSYVLFYSIDFIYCILSRTKYSLLEIELSYLFSTLDVINADTNYSVTSSGSWKRNTVLFYILCSHLPNILTVHVRSAHAGYHLFVKRINCRKQKKQ